MTEPKNTVFKELLYASGNENLVVVKSGGCRAEKSTDASGGPVSAEEPDSQ